MLNPENFLFHATPKQKKDEEMVLNLEQLERQAIEKALRISDGNISRAAEYLGIPRNGCRTRQGAVRSEAAAVYG